MEGALSGLTLLTNLNRPSRDANLPQKDGTLNVLDCARRWEDVFQVIAHFFANAYRDVSSQVHLYVARFLTRCHRKNVERILC